MNQIDRIFDKAPDSIGFVDEYLGYLVQVISGISREEVAQFIAVLLAARDRGANIYFIGNGGSSATASHFANDVSIGSCSWEKPFKAISLVDNNAVFSAIANDYGYEDVFYQQLRVHLQKPDVLVAISASGNSPNLIKAVDYANDLGAITVGLTAFDGGALRKKAKYAVHIPTNKGEYGPAEDGHMILDHLIGAYLARIVRDSVR